MNPKTLNVRKGTVQVVGAQVGEASVIVWDVYSWRNMGSLICLETILLDDGFVTRKYAV